MTLNTARGRSVAALIGTACAMLLAACSNSLGPESTALSVSLSVQRPTFATTVLRVQMDNRAVTVQAPPSGTTYSETRTPAPRYGSVPVQATLLSAAGTTLATVQFSQDFRRDETHWITAFVGTTRPVGFCIGSLAVAPLTSSGSDTLFVTYGSIPNGAVC